MKDPRVVNLLISAVIIALAVGLAVYSWTVLPDVVATQPAVFNTGAPPVSKFVAVGMCTALMIVFAYVGNKERKLFLGSLIGIAMHIAFWLSN